MISVIIAAVYRGFPDLILLGLVLIVQSACVYLLVRGPLRHVSQASKSVRRMVVATGAASALWLILGFVLMYVRVARYFPAHSASWIRGTSMIWTMLWVLWAVAWIAWRALAAVIKPAHSAPRRNFLKASGAALFAAPVAAIGYGSFIERRNIRLREVNIPIPNLAPELDGMRIVQLTDIHLSQFLSERDLARAVAMANETVAHLALVTGDMISAKRDPLDQCLRQLARVRAELGIFGCLGNHEIYAQAEDYATTEGARLGIRYLRSEAVRLEFGGARLNLAGVDYQRFHTPYLRDAEKMVAPGILNVLLSHNPDVFPVAARQGYDLTIAGHTHGGQVRIEILSEDLNVARFFTHYVDGLYHEQGRSIFVSRGIGTIGLPARLGAPPEVALLRLCRS